MADDTLHAQLAETQKLLEQLVKQKGETQKQREEAQKQLEEAQKQAEEAQKQAKEAQKQLQPTTLFEYLDALHTAVYCKAKVSVVGESTTGSAENAAKKIRPDRIRRWDSFPMEQQQLWATIMESDFAQQRHFKSLSAVAAIADDYEVKSIGSEMDLNKFEDTAIDSHVAAAIRKVYSCASLRDEFGLKGNVLFENHPNTLGSEFISDGMEGLSLNPTNCAENSGNAENAFNKTSLGHVRADQFCVYNSVAGNSRQRVPVFVAEYKPPHKLNAEQIKAGLQDMDLEDVTRATRKNNASIRYRRLVAAVITQAFSYMIYTGVEYGLVSTGMALIFLRVSEDPTTVEYFLSLPREDVGLETGFKDDNTADNRLHLTAVGQMFAFTLRAMKAKPRSQAWRTRAISQLKVWNITYNDLLRKVEEDDPSSVYRPQRQNDYIRMSPVKLRPRKTVVATSWCKSSDESLKDQDGSDPDSDKSSNDSNPPKTPCPPSNGPGRSNRIQLSDNKALDSKSSGKETKRSYCTNNCLLGLLAGDKLDKKCPNVRLHGTVRHTITGYSFLDRMREQMFTNPDEGCEEFGVNGSRGVLFKVRLLSHGYTLIAKGTVSHLIPHLRHERAIYEKLRPVQGKHVPVCLGGINLKNPWFYQGFAAVVHMLFLSFCGISISYVNVPGKALQCEVVRSLKAVHANGVLQRDAEARNLLWHEGRAMVIDFERAKVDEYRKVLSDISVNGVWKSAGNKLVRQSEEFLEDCDEELSMTLRHVKTIIRQRNA